MEKLNKDLLRQFLKRDFVFFDKIGSTFDVKDSPIVIAAEQISGIGRHGRSFYSGLGGIYFCIKTEIRPLLTINAAAGVMKAMQKRNFTPWAKWVNDIFLDNDNNNNCISRCGFNLYNNGFLKGGNNFNSGNNRDAYNVDSDSNLANNCKSYGNCKNSFKKKVCGILAKADGYNATIGVGINYCACHFPPDLKNIATNMYQKTDGINEFTALVIDEVLKAIYQNNLEFYKSRLLGIGKDITLPDGTVAIMNGIDDSGHLLYIKNDRQFALSYGDIII